MGILEKVENHIKNAVCYPKEQVFYIITMKDQAVILGDPYRLSTKFLKAASIKLDDIIHDDRAWSLIKFDSVDLKNHGQCSPLTGIFAFWGHQYNEEDDVDIWINCEYIDGGADKARESLIEASMKMKKFVEKSIERYK